MAQSGKNFLTLIARMDKIRYNGASLPHPNGNFFLKDNSPIFNAASYNR